MESVIAPVSVLLMMTIWCAAFMILGKVMVAGHKQLDFLGKVHTILQIVQQVPHLGRQAFHATCFDADTLSSLPRS